MDMSKIAELEERLKEIEAIEAKIKVMKQEIERVKTQEDELSLEVRKKSWGVFNGYTTPHGKNEKYLDRIMFEEEVRRKLQKFADENNQCELDWNDSHQPKYYIDFNYLTNNHTEACVTLTRDFSQVYFSSHSIREKAIKTFKDELIRYFTRRD